MRHRLSENAEYTREEQRWSDAAERGDFDDALYELGPDGQYHSRPDNHAHSELDIQQEQVASDAAIERAEAYA